MKRLRDWVNYKVTIEDRDFDNLRDLWKCMDLLDSAGIDYLVDVEHWSTEEEEPD